MPNEALHVCSLISCTYLRFQERFVIGCNHALLRDFRLFRYLSGLQMCTSSSLSAFFVSTEPFGTGNLFETFWDGWTALHIVLLRQCFHLGLWGAARPNQTHNTLSVCHDSAKQKRKEIFYVLRPCFSLSCLSLLCFSQYSDIWWTTPKWHMPSIRAVVLCCTQFYSPLQTAKRKSSSGFQGYYK